MCTDAVYAWVGWRMNMYVCEAWIQLVRGGICWHNLVFKVSRLWCGAQCSAAEVLQGNLTAALRGCTETKLPVYPHKPAEVSHSWSVRSFHSLGSVSCLNCQYVCALKTEWKCVLCHFCLCDSKFPQQCECIYVGFVIMCQPAWLFKSLGGVIPVCWQSRKTEGSVYADLNPLHLNCHL